MKYQPKFPTCPYKASSCNQCSHKGQKASRKNKRYCSYKNEKKCPLYQEWLKTSQDAHMEELNTTEVESEP